VPRRPKFLIRCSVLRCARPFAAGGPIAALRRQCLLAFGDPTIELYQGSLFSLRQKLPCVAVMRNKTIAPDPILAFVLDFPDADLA